MYLFFITDNCSLFNLDKTLFYHSSASSSSCEKKHRFNFDVDKKGQRIDQNGGEHESKKNNNFLIF